MTTYAQPAAGWARPPLEGTAGTVAALITGMVKQAARDAPRSLQRQIGPSELGTPCLRRLGYRALDWDPKPNCDTDPWAATVGTAVHEWIAAMFTEHNTQLGAQRWLTEHKVTLPGGIPGSCDLYDTWEHTVIDWKTTGNDALKRYRRDGPGAQYRTQAHLYALGMQLAGHTPQNVVIVFLPRGGRLDGLHAWAEPYNPGVAVAALKRYQAIRSFHITVDPEQHPERWALLPTADAYCTYCPWFLPGSADLSQGCPGHNTTQERR